MNSHFFIMKILQLDQELDFWFVKETKSSFGYIIPSDYITWFLLSFLSLLQIVQCKQKYWDGILCTMCWVSAVKKSTLFLKVGFDRKTGFWPLNWVSTVNLGFDR